MSQTQDSSVMNTTQDFSDRGERKTLTRKSKSRHVNTQGKSKPKKERSLDMHEKKLLELKEKGVPVRFEKNGRLVSGVILDIDRYAVCIMDSSVNQELVIMKSAISSFCQDARGK